MILTFWSSIFCGALNAEKQFTLPALSHLFRALITPGFAFLTRSWMDIHGVIVGYLIGETVSMLALRTARFRFSIMTIAPT